MRKIILFVMVTLDGFFEGPNGEIDWHNVDEEFNIFATDQLNSVDVLLFGRRTFELMAGYWPTPSATRDSPIIAAKMNELPKIVFSRTLGDVGWNNSRLIKENIAEEISRLKQRPGKDLIIFGSANLAASFVRLNLIDEFRIMVNPVILGNGKPLFAGIHDRLKLTLLKIERFESGNVLLYYEPER